MALPARIAPSRHSGRVPGRAAAAAPIAGARAHAIDPLAPRAVGQRPMVRATAGIVASSAARPALTVVPRRRRAARFVAAMCVVIVIAMLGAAAFQTQLAQRQLEMDRLDQSISAAREQYEVLRQERAELRSPARLAGVAAAAGMVPARQSSFVPVSADLVAVVQESVGQLGRSAAAEHPDPLEQFRVVKSLSTGVAP